MTVRRVWLSEWEWACCGDPFSAGQHVTLLVDPVAEPDPWLCEHLGAELAATIDGIESHHEAVGAETLRGRVLAIHGVALRHTSRHVARGAASAEPVLEVRLPGVEAGRFRPLGDEATVLEPIPGSGTLHEAPRVPWPPCEAGPAAASAGPVPEGLAGYLVDVETAPRPGCRFVDSGRTDGSIRADLEPSVRPERVRGGRHQPQAGSASARPSTSSSHARWKQASRQAL